MTLKQLEFISAALWKWLVDNDTTESLRDEIISTLTAVGDEVKKIREKRMSGIWSDEGCCTKAFTIKKEEHGYSLVVEYTGGPYLGKQIFEDIPDLKSAVKLREELMEKERKAFDDMTEGIHNWTADYHYDFTGAPWEPSLWWTGPVKSDVTEKKKER